MRALKSSLAPVLTIALLSACSSTSELVEYTQRGNLVVIDAGVWSDNSASDRQTWQTASIGTDGATAAKLVEKQSTTSATTATLQYDIDFTTTGEFQLWVLAKDAIGTADASLAFGTDQGGQQWQISGFGSDWTWVSADADANAIIAPVSTPGTHLLTLESDSAGLIVDRILLTSDSSYVPTNRGPETTLDDSSDVFDDSTENNTTDDHATPDSNDSVSGETTDTDTDTTDDTAAPASAVISGPAAAVAGQSITLTATLQQYGKLTPPLYYYWSIINGPAGATVTSQQSATTELHFIDAGHYQIQVNVSDGTNDTATVTSIDVTPPLNTPPSFDQPAAVEATAETAIELQYHAHDDGLPNSDVYYFWSKTSGPGQVVFSARNEARTQATFSTEGLYTLQLNASDGELHSNLALTVEVAKKPVTSLNGQFNQRWDSVSSHGSPQARHETGGVVVNGKLYVIGGRGLTNIDVYDAKANKWTKSIKPPFEMHHFQPVAIDEKIYLVGGMTCCYPAEKAIDRVQIFDTRNSTWTQGTTIPASRRRGGAGAAVYNGKIYIVGGNTRGHSGGAVNWLDEFDPKTGNWKTLANAPDARDHANASIIGNKLVIAAGRRSAHPNTFANTVGSTNVYDFSTGQWQSTSNIPTQRAGAMTVAVGSELLVIGGESTKQNSAHTEVEAYNVNTKIWRKLASLGTGRHSGTAVIIDDHVHVVAGAVTLGGSRETTSHEKLKFK